MEEQSQQLGNITLKVKEGQKTQATAFKCKYISCPALFMDYKDLQSHYVLKHGDMPKFLNQQNGIMFEKRFSKKSLGKQNLYITKYKISKMATMLGIFMNANIAKKIKEDEKKKVKV